MEKIIQKARDIVNPKKDIKELLGLHNLYSSNKFWELGGRPNGSQLWRLLCLGFVKQTLVARGVLSTDDIDAPLEAKEDFEPEEAPGLVIHINVEENQFEFIKDSYDMEADLNTSQSLKDLIQDHKKAIAMYGSLCNVDWYKNGIRWSCSWRYAGGLVADLRNQNEAYLDYYCSGNEGTIDDEIAEEFAKLGWTVGVTDTQED